MSLQDRLNRAVYLAGFTQLNLCQSVSLASGKKLRRQQLQQWLTGTVKAGKTLRFFLPYLAKELNTNVDYLLYGYELTVLNNLIEIERLTLVTRNMVQRMQRK